MMKYIVLALTVLSFASCKKTYTCSATANGIVSEFECKNCKKKDVDAYKVDIESKGYTDVNCQEK